MQNFLLKTDAGQQAARAATTAFNQCHEGLEELSQINTDLLRLCEDLPGRP
jgi:hypothetical protein